MIKTIIAVFAAAALGYIAGSAAVYAFNRMPDEWLGADEEGRETQRVKSVPWKYVLSATFIVCGIYMAVRDPMMAPAVFAALFLLVEAAMAAKLYGGVPIQLGMLLLLCGVAVISQTDDFREYVTGALIGIACLGVLIAAAALARRLSRRKNAGAKNGTVDEAAGRTGTGTAGSAGARIANGPGDFGLAAAVILLNGGVQGTAVIAAACCVWIVRLMMCFSAQRKRRADLPGSSKEAAIEAYAGAEPPSFFIAVLAAAWMVINISHVII